MALRIIDIDIRLINEATERGLIPVAFRNALPREPRLHAGNIIYGESASLSSRLIFAVPSPPTHQIVKIPEKVRKLAKREYCTVEVRVVKRGERFACLNGNVWKSEIALEDCSSILHFVLVPYREKTVAERLREVARKLPAETKEEINYLADELEEA